MTNEVFLGRPCQLIAYEKDGHYYLKVPEGKNYDRFNPVCIYSMGYSQGFVDNQKKVKIEND